MLVAVGMLLLTIVGMVEPAGAAFPGKNGKIVFVCSGEICTMNPNGQGVDTLTNNSVVTLLTCGIAEGEYGGPR